jgi:hypothetical protein
MCVHRKVRFSSSELISPLAQPGVVCKREAAGHCGVGDLVKVDCAACHHVALLTAEALLRIGLSSGAKVLDLKGRLGLPGLRKEGARGCLGHVGGGRAHNGFPSDRVPRCRGPRCRASSAGRAGISSAREMAT